ncbi:hypothetical protein COOONC_27496 [Cooperia oncophora]
MGEGKVRKAWEGSVNDGRDEEARKAFEKTLFITDHMGAGADDSAYQNFSRLVVSRMGEAPFNCVEECEGERYSAVSRILIFLVYSCHDSLIHYPTSEGI